MSKALVIFRKLGGKIVPIRVSDGIKVVDKSMKTEAFKKEQIELTRQYIFQSRLKLNMGK